jgi:predicted dehydrogenase
LPDDIHVAVIGAGRQGRDLINYGLDLPGLRFKAVCDIWPYARTYAANLLKKRGHPCAAYEDYREMLAKEKDLAAAIIATPDAFHCEQTLACLKAGLHVYCEKEMALTIEDCRTMVQASRQAERLLQVGRQHRSNPRYHLALEYIYEKKALGRITNVFGQWHGHRRVKLTWPEKLAIDEATLKRYGYESMEQFRNWRWFAKFSAGELVNLGAHQIDVFNWFLRTPPKAVMADGGLDYYDFYELYDNATCLFDWDYAWEGKTRTVRGLYDVNTTTEEGGFYEQFIGDETTLIISEDATKGGIWREDKATVASWEKDLPVIVVMSSSAKRYHKAQGTISDMWLLSMQKPPDVRWPSPIPRPGGFSAIARVFPSIPDPLGDKPPHWYHLKNFFDAIRGVWGLNCPAEVGYQGAVAALRAVEAMKAGRRLELKPEEFVV